MKNKQLFTNKYIHTTIEDFNKKINKRMLKFNVYMRIQPYMILDTDEHFLTPTGFSRPAPVLRTGKFFPLPVFQTSGPSQTDKRPQIPTLPIPNMMYK